MAEFLYVDITKQIIGSAFEVWKVLGYGFLEKVYENALVEELRRANLKAQQQFPSAVFYKDVQVSNILQTCL